MYTLGLPMNSKYAEDICELHHIHYDFSLIERCPICGTPVSGGKWVEPKKVVLSGKKAPDFLLCIPPDVHYLLSERAMEAVRSYGITGIIKAEKIQDVAYKRHGTLKAPDYYQLTIERSRVTINHQVSIIQYMMSHSTRTCPLCRQVPALYDSIGKLQLNLEQYEGYDIFHIYELGNCVFLSQKFVDMCKQEKLTGFWYNTLDNHEKNLTFD